MSNTKKLLVGIVGLAVLYFVICGVQAGMSAYFEALADSIFAIG